MISRIGRTAKVVAFPGIPTLFLLALALWVASWVSIELGETTVEPWIVVRDLWLASLFTFALIACLGTYWIPRLARGRDSLSGDHVLLYGYALGGPIAVWVIMLISMDVPLWLHVLAPVALVAVAAVAAEEWTRLTRIARSNSDS